MRQLAAVLDGEERPKNGDWHHHESHAQKDGGGGLARHGEVIDGIYVSNEGIWRGIFFSEAQIEQ